MPFSKFLFGIIDSKLPFLFSDIKYVSAIGHTQRMPFFGQLQLLHSDEKDSDNL